MQVLLDASCVIVISRWATAVFRLTYLVENCCVPSDVSCRELFVFLGSLNRLKADLNLKCV